MLTVPDPASAVGSLARSGDTSARVRSTLTGTTGGRTRVANPRKLHQPKGWAFGLCVAILEPVLLPLTKRRWKGGENIPETGGCVLAVNHISHLDPLTCAHFVYAWGRIVRFLAKAELFDVPVRRAHREGRPADPRLPDDHRRLAVLPGGRRGGASAASAWSSTPRARITRQPDLWPMIGQDRGCTDRAVRRRAGDPGGAVGRAPASCAPYTKVPHLFPRKTISMTAGRARRTSTTCVARS